MLILLLILSSFAQVLCQFQVRDSSFIDELNITSEVKGSSDITPRFLKSSFFNRPSIFNIVRFPNDECFDSSNQSGICYTAFECKKTLGGAPSGSCAGGLGACCIVSRTCHNSTSHRVVYFKNPSYPQSDSQQNFCDLTVNILDPDVCQLRLDFLDFQLDQPFKGECLGDKLTISASGFAPTSVPTLCGVNRNQHMYVSLPREMRDRSASIVFTTDNVGDYRWHVRITQIDCNRFGKKFGSANTGRTQRAGFSTAFTTSLKQSGLDSINMRNPLYSLPAPHGCLQYYTQPTGVVESFNFGDYLNNLEYAICIERQPTTCRTIFTATEFEWAMDRNGLNGANKQLSGVGDVDCASDYLNIPAASNTGDGITYDRYCGGRLNYRSDISGPSPVISKANGPIILRFHTDYIHDESVKTGFRLRYEQSSTDCFLQYSFGSGFGFQQSQPVAANLVKSSEINHNNAQDRGYENNFNEKERKGSNGRNNGKILII